MLHFIYHKFLLFFKNKINSLKIQNITKNNKTVNLPANQHLIF